MEARATAVSIAKTASERDITFLAAGFAYYAFVSLIPLALLAVVLGSLLGGEQAAEAVIAMVGDYLPEAGEAMVVATLTTETGHFEATVVALLVATWGSLKVFRGLSRAFNTVYGEHGSESLVQEVLEGLAVAVGITGALALMVVAGVMIGVLPVEIPLAQVVGWTVLVGGLFIAFVPIYYVLPPIRIPLREALPGAVVATLGWTVLQWGFQFYAANAGQYEAYGVIGAVLLFVTWLYFAGIIVMLGAVVNVVIARPEQAVT